MKWTILAAAAIGLAVGLGAYTFVYAKGASYLSTDPAVCANCHIMNEHFAAWQRSSHRAVAGCSDCHMPHDVVGKYLTKASNGFWHSVAFTSGRFPDPLMIKPHNRAIVERSCRYCHEAVTEAILASAGPEGSIEAGVGGSPTSTRPQLHDGAGAAGTELSCTFCHTYAGHWVR
jgi:cytochrome c nitrite reductase small subunit